MHMNVLIKYLTNYRNTWSKKPYHQVNMILRQTPKKKERRLLVGLLKDNTFNSQPVDLAALCTVWNLVNGKIIESKKKTSEKRLEI